VIRLFPETTAIEAEGDELEPNQEEQFIPLKLTADYLFADINTTATHIRHPPPDLPLERGGIGKTSMKVGKTHKISSMRGRSPIKSPPLQGEG
jgi:hypothetical protein